MFTGRSYANGRHDGRLARSTQQGDRRATRGRRAPKNRRGQEPEWHAKVTSDPREGQVRGARQKETER